MVETEGGHSPVLVASDAIGWHISVKSIRRDVRCGLCMRGCVLCRLLCHLSYEISDRGRYDVLPPTSITSEVFL